MSIILYNKTEKKQLALFKGQMFQFGPTGGDQIGSAVMSEQAAKSIIKDRSDIFTDNRSEIAGADLKGQEMQEMQVLIDVLKEQNEKLKTENAICKKLLDESVEHIDNLVAEIDATAKKSVKKTDKVDADKAEKKAEGLKSE